MASLENGNGPDSKRRKTNRYHKNDEYYFESYSHLTIHEDMLKDEARTKAYRDAILKNAEDFKDKVVLDVGAGTCILSFFCAIAGARKVYAVEASDIADQAELLVKQNKLSHKVTIVKGKVEEIEIPEPVDIIVSEWMGYFLVYESMLASVFYARDKWLKPSGMMFPAIARIYLVPFTDEEYVAQKLSFWKDVYGFDFSPIIPFAKKCAFAEPAIECLSPSNEMDFPLVIKTIDCKTASLEEIKETHFDFRFKSMIMGTLHGFMSWFDVVFKGSQATLNLSTAPRERPTHWKQTLFYFDDPVELNQDQVIEGKISITENAENNRFLDIKLSFKTNKDDQYTTKLFTMQ